jgi:hypothetical protein
MQAAQGARLMGHGMIVLHPIVIKAVFGHLAPAPAFGKETPAVRKAAGGNDHHAFQLCVRNLHGILLKTRQ